MKKYYAKKFFRSFAYLAALFVEKYLKKYFIFFWPGHCYKVKNQHLIYKNTYKSYISFINLMRFGTFYIILNVISDNLIICLRHICFSLKSFHLFRLTSTKRWWYSNDFNFNSSFYRLGMPWKIFNLFNVFWLSNYIVNFFHRHFL